MIAVFAFIGTTMAQYRTEEMQNLEKAKQFVEWLKATSRDMGQELNKARREHNQQKINCLESRHGDLQKMIAESEGKYAELRTLTLEKKSAAASDVYKSVIRLQKVAQQIVKLANDCLKHIGEEGAFTETLEEFTGDVDLAAEKEDIITNPPPVEGFPGPFPPVYQGENITPSNQQQ